MYAKVDPKLKKAAQWTTYFVIVFIILITVISLVVNLVAPTLFPSTDISGFRAYINTAAMILSFLSAGLGFFSIWQANTSNRQAVDILNGIHEIEAKQDLLTKDIMSMGKQNVQRADANTNAVWTPDRDVT